MGLTSEFKEHIGGICKDNYAPNALKNNVVFHHCWDSKPYNNDIFIGNKATIRKLYNILQQSDNLLKKSWVI